MLQKITLLTALAWVLTPSFPTYAQDPPSLGDVARQARKEKEKNGAQAKKVITEDNLPSNKALGGLSDLASSQSSSDGSARAKGSAALDQLTATLNKLEPMDRSTLAKLVLLDKDVNFPDRRSWEDKLYSAKERYVSHGRELVREMRQILEDADSLRSARGGQGKLSPDDPRAQEMLRKVQELIQDAVRTDATYQAVVMEGWDRAKQAKH